MGCGIYTLGSGCCVVNSLRRYRSVSLQSKGQDVLIDQYNKDNVSLWDESKTAFSFHKIQILQVQCPPAEELSDCPDISWPFLHCPVGIGAGELAQIHIPWQLLFLRVIKSFVADTGVPCVLLASTKLCRVRLLDCK